MTDTKTNKIGRVFSYMRWSSEPQQWGDSERRQAQMAEDWCKRAGRALSDKTFADRGISGWKGANRKSGALGDLLKIAGEGDTVLIEDCDRWSREEALDALTALRTTVQRGVEVVFLKRGVSVNKNNFNEDSVLIPLFFGSLLANKENEKRSYRIREAMKGRREQMEQGRAVQGRLPAWLDWDARQGKPVVNESKAKSVRRMFELCLAGHGMVQIEQMMRGTPPITQRDSYQKQKASWNSFLVHRTLTDKSVLGYQRSSGLKVFPPIIDEKTFYAVSTRIKARSTLHVRIRSRRKNDNLFTGLLKCSECGATYIRQRAISKGKNYDYVVCSGALRKATKCQKLGHVNCDKLEASFLSLLSETDFIKELMTGNRGPSKSDALNGELADVQRQCEKYLRLIEGDENPPRRIVENLKLLEAKEAQLQAEVEAEAVKAKGETPADDAYEMFRSEFAATAQQPEHRSKVRDLLHDIVDRIVINRGTKPQEYVVHLKGAKMPITVILVQGGWLFNPAPNWLFAHGTQS